MKSTKKDNFSIRKLTVGTASVFLGATVTPIIFDLPSTIVNEAKASEAPVENINKNNVTNTLKDQEIETLKNTIFYTNALFKENSVYDNAFNNLYICK